MIAENVIKEVIEKMETAPRYLIGEWKEAAQENSFLAYDKENDGNKYPLIFLDRKFPKKEGEEKGVAYSCTVDLYFIVETEENYTTQQRLDNTYVQLYELWNEFKFTGFKWNKFVYDFGENLPNETFQQAELEHLYFRPNNLNDIVDVLKVTTTLKIRKNGRI